MTNVNARPIDWSVDGDLDSDGIPNVLDSLAMVLATGTVWHNQFAALCKSADFDALSANNKFCRTILESNWATPWDSSLAAAGLTVLDGTLSKNDYNKLVCETFNVETTSSNNVATALYSSASGVSTFAAIGVLNSRSRANRAGALNRLRVMLANAVKAAQAEV